MSKIGSIFWDKDLQMLSTFGFVSFIFLGVPAIIFLIFIGIRQVDYHYTSNNCPKQLQAMQRRGKFVSYNFWSYECLVKTSNNTYIPIDNTYNNIQESK